MVTTSLPMPADAAGVSDAIVELLAGIVLWLVSLLGKLLLAVISILIGIAQYNHFIDVEAVQTGWTIVRDVSNMFFILVLLVIAFGTILRIEQYRYQRLLGKLILMAILINLSKFIAGFFIDLMQVIMLTFVNAFKDAAAGNFTEMFQLKHLLSFREDTSPPPVGEIFLATILAAAFLVIALMVTLIMVVVLIIRIIMLWILVILSPLAYILAAYPGTQKYSSMWWSSFWKHAVIGPVLAFFLWLALTVTTTTTDTLVKQVDVTTQDVSSQVLTSTTPGTTEFAASVSQASSTQGILKFILGIGMLMGALMVTQQFGGVAGNLAGGAVSRIQKAGAAPLAAARAAARWGVKRADDAQAVIQRRFAGTPLAKDIAAGGGPGRVGQFIQKRGGGWLARRVDLEGMRKALTMHGVQFRAIPQAWKLRADTKETQRVGEAASVGQDVMNRFFGGYILGKPEKTDYATLARAARERKVRAEVQAAGIEQEIFNYRIQNQYTDKEGRALPDKEADLATTLFELSGNHDINETLKLPFYAKALQSQGRASQKVSRIDVAAVLLHMFGNKPNTIRIAKNLEEIGLHTNEAYLKGLTKVNKRGEIDWHPDVVNPATGNVWTVQEQMARSWKDDKSAALSAAHNAKATGRQYIGKQRRQNLLIERADNEGNLSFREASVDALPNFLEGAAAYRETKLEHFQPEFKTTDQKNLDSLLLAEKDARDKGEIAEAQGNDVHYALAKLAGGALGYDEGEIARMIAPAVGDVDRGEVVKNLTQKLGRVPTQAEIDQKVKNVIADGRRELDKMIINAVETVQNQEFWENEHTVNVNRTAAGDDLNDSAVLSGSRDIDEAIYQRMVSTGKTTGINPKLDFLRQRAGVPIVGGLGSTAQPAGQQQAGAGQAAGAQAGGAGAAAAGAAAAAGGAGPQAGPTAGMQPGPQPAPGGPSAPQAPLPTAASVNAKEKREKELRRAVSKGGVSPEERQAKTEEADNLRRDVVIERTELSAEDLKDPEAAKALQGVSEKAMQDFAASLDRTAADIERGMSGSQFIESMGKTMDSLKKVILELPSEITKNLTTRVDSMHQSVTGGRFNEPTYQEKILETLKRIKETMKNQQTKRAADEGEDLSAHAGGLE